MSIAYLQNLSAVICLYYPQSCYLWCSMTFVCSMYMHSNTMETLKGMGLNVSIFSCKNCVYNEVVIL